MLKFYFCALWLASVFCFFFYYSIWFFVSLFLVLGCSLTSLSSCSCPFSFLYFFLVPFFLPFFLSFVFSTLLFLFPDRELFYYFSYPFCSYYAILISVAQNIFRPLCLVIRSCCLVASVCEPGMMLTILRHEDYLVGNLS